MKRTGDMQVNVAGLRRNIKNVAHNYSLAQRKVREATSNDPWGPSSTIMAEVSDLTYNVVAFTEIMQMIWKRLNDHGKNWRHVYKALMLLEYLIKTGNEKVSQQCKENIFAIQTLKDFQYMEEGKDQGQNVREKAKQLVNLLKDDERLKNERARAIKAKERFAQSACAFGSDGGLDTPTSPKYPNYRSEWNTSRDSAELPRDLEVARPQTAGEEELQLQLALAMSREEAEQEEQKRRSDDVRLQLALSQSQQDFKTNQQQPDGKSSNVLDLLDVNLDGEAATKDPWGMPQSSKPQNTSSPWHGNGVGSGGVADPWAPSSPALPPPGAASNAGAMASKPAATADPWSPKAITTPLVETAIRNDPWSPVSHSSSSELDEFDAITNRNRSSPMMNTNGTNNGSSAQNNVTSNNNSDPFELNLLGDALANNSGGPSPSTGATKKTPQSFLGENSALVNLDNLVTSKPAPAAAAGNHQQQLMANPFSDVVQQPTNRPIFNAQPPKPSMNQIKQAAPFMANATGGPYAYGFNQNQQQPPMAPVAPPNGTGSAAVVDPWTPVPSTGTGSGATAQLGAPWMKPGYTF